MHGHGDRPHLCYYPGCERGIPGNGFPRRYNLFDHMKRVHDHREEQPTLGQLHSPGSRQAGARKRKASGPVDEPCRQPRKSLRVQQPSPPLPSGAFTLGPAPFQESTHGPGEDNRQRLIYSQWANQHELLKFQMMSAPYGSVDQANVQRLTQNIDDLRRRSDDSNQG